MQFNRAFFRKLCKKVEAVITLELIDWVNLDKSDDNSAYVSSLNKFREMYYKNIPTKTIQLKYNTLDIFNINEFFIACFRYSYHNNLLFHTFKSASTRGPARGGTSHLTNFGETWPVWRGPPKTIHSKFKEIWSKPGGDDHPPFFYKNDKKSSKNWSKA